MEKCPKCGKELQGNESFCIDCGEKLYYCPKCGAASLTNEGFCECFTKCNAGTELKQFPYNNSSSNSNCTMCGWWWFLLLSADSSYT